ncbi:tyrosine-type recombinase/integrase [Candidatus Woesearchaeota archaeon]|nr:tyrosine-type recombinase/integrase [Candidatus Woesearchaeota archaeon]
MKKEIDIHNYPKRLAGALEQVRKAAISERNRQLILEFRDFCSVENISMPRIERYLGVLVFWAKTLQADFDKVTKEDITEAVRFLQENDYSPWTKSTYKIMLKRFFKWLKKAEDEMPYEVKWISTAIKKTDKKFIDNAELLTEDEVRALINAADHPRDKALVATLYESGTRIGEHGSLQIANVKFDEHGAILNVVGKTGPRSVRIISSAPLLGAWLNMHPHRNEPDSPLWVNIGSANHNKVMRYDNIRCLLQRLFEKISIKKRFNPHIFRHARASFLADHLTEFQMNQYFGWIQGSKMPSTYVHMSGKQIDASILALNGIQQDKENIESRLKPKVCQRCNTMNAVDARYCTKCSGILDLKSAFEVEEKLRQEKEARERADSILNLLVKDPDFMKVFEEKVKGLKEAIY